MPVVLKPMPVFLFMLSGGLLALLNYRFLTVLIGKLQIILTVALDTPMAFTYHGK